MELRDKMVQMAERMDAWLRTRVLGLRRGLERCRDEESAQGTVEYAILVAVLVVLAIVAITALAPSVQTLWDSINDAFGSLAKEA